MAMIVSKSCIIKLISAWRWPRGFVFDPDKTLAQSAPRSLLAAWYYSIASGDIPSLQAI
jgi:hypothetical protein